MRSNKTVQYQLLQYSFSHKFSCYSNEPSPSGAAEHIDSSGVFPWRVPHETPCPAARIDCEPLPCRLKKACRPGARCGRHGAVVGDPAACMLSPTTPSPCRACTEETEARLALAPQNGMGTSLNAMRPCTGRRRRRGRRRVPIRRVQLSLSPAMAMASDPASLPPPCS